MPNSRGVTGGAVCSRTFIPHVCHAAIGVLGAVSVATACAIAGAPANAVAAMPNGSPKRISIEHPSGKVTVEIDVAGEGAATVVRRAALLRTARRLFEGRVLVPEAALRAAAE